MCLGAGTTCKLIYVYSGESVSADNWLFNSDATSGIIGMGPGSGFWNGYTDPTTLQSTYSIALARITYLTENEVGATTVASNITFGSAASSAYTGSSMTISALSNYSYGLSNLGFGIVYQESGKDSSQYFYELPTYYPVKFTTNFMGLGLPAAIYTEVVTLLEYISSGTVECDSTQDGICVMPEACSNYTNFTSYTFLFNFTTNKTNYMRVPLATFATTQKGSGGTAKCNIAVTYLSPINTQSSNVILGGMFFQEMFGVFTNDHSTDPVTQTAQIYTGLNALYNAYVGSETLPTGTNPFVPAPTPTPDDKKKNLGWIIALSIIAGLLLIGLGFALYKWQTAKKATAEKKAAIYDDKKPLMRNSEEI